MKLQRNVLLTVTFAAAFATPALAQMAPPEAAEMFTGIWWHPTLPSFEPLATGPKPVTNKTRYRGVSDYNNLVGDYSNPILKPWAAEVVKKYGDISLSGEVAPSPANQCWPEPPPFIYKNFGLQMLLKPNEITLIYEQDQEFRKIRMNQKHPEKVKPSFYGDSVGHWEGDTLVVDVTDLTDATWFDRSGNFHSDALHVTERFTLMDKNVIRYEATINDPQVFTRPWKISMPLYRRLEPNAQLTDFRCVEMVEETMYGHLRKEQLVKRWVGNTMTVDITRTIPPGEAVHERYISGNPPPAK
jgi:hypothetical protein